MQLLKRPNSNLYVAGNLKSSMDTIPHIKVPIYQVKLLLTILREQPLLEGMQKKIIPILVS